MYGNNKIHIKKFVYWRRSLLRYMDKGWRANVSNLCMLLKYLSSVHV